MTAHLKELVSISPDPIIGVNREGIINLFNLAAERLLGYSAEEVLDQMTITQFYPSLAQARQIKKLIYASPDRQIEGCETQLMSKTGRTIDIRLSAKLLMRDKQESGSIGFFHDMTERKRLESALTQMSITDNLTGLYNQRHFHAMLKVELERSARYQRPLCLVCIDLDNFKQVNDKLGHLQGDHALRFAARALQKDQRQTDMTFRYGGDEFMLILPETNHEEVQAIARRLKASFDEHWAKEWATIPGSPPVSMSIGVAEFDQLESAEALIRRADEAMYAKKEHRVLKGCSA